MAAGNFSPPMDAPAIGELVVVGAGHLKPFDIAFLRRHPTLKRIPAPQQQGGQEPFGAA